MFIFILLWLSQTFPVTLTIEELIFSGCTVPPDIRRPNLEEGRYIGETSGSHYPWKCVTKAIFSSVDILKVTQCYLLL